MCSARSRKVQITSKGLDNEGIAQKLLEEEKVAMVPGSAFGIGFVLYALLSKAGLEPKAVELAPTPDA